MKRILAVVTALLLCSCILSVTVFAAGVSASLSGPGTVRAGDTITVTFSLSGSGLYGASGKMSYDSSRLTLKSTSQQIASPWVVEFSGSNFVAYDNDLSNPINSSAALFSATFTVNSNVAAGSTIQVSCTGVTASDGSADSNIGTVSYSKTVSAPLSADNKLKSLTVKNAVISPAFSANTTSYTAEVPYSVSKLDISAVANHSGAKVSVSNPSLTANATTKITVTVTAENGSTKTYTIAVKRAQDPNYVPSNNNSLASITVEGFLLSPVFAADNTQYVIWLPYETEAVNVAAAAADSKASVQILGGENLLPGADNEIQVICTAEDGSQKAYLVIAKRAAAHGEPVEETTEATEPETTEPALTEPTVTGATEPVGTKEENPWNNRLWVAVLSGVLCLAAGMGIGILIGQKSRKIE